MRKYYTRPCNFYYGTYAKKLVKNKKAFPLAANSNIAFDHIDVFQRKKKRIIKSNIYPINEIKILDRDMKSIVNIDIKKIISKRKDLCGIKINTPQIMGVLNVTPDSFSDGGKFFNNKLANRQVKKLLDDGAKIVDLGGESTRPGAKEIDPQKEWKRIKSKLNNLRKRKCIISLDTRKSFIIKKKLTL